MSYPSEELPTRHFVARWLGRQDYGTVLDLQRSVQEQRLRGEIPDTLLLVEHFPVVTLGRGAKRENVLVVPEVLQAHGVALYETERGGDVTYHGPGQLVAYPIFDLKPERCDVRRYVHDLGRVMVRLAKLYGLEAGIGATAALMGVWVDAAHPKRPWSGHEHAEKPVKIGAIGVRLTQWVTLHGMAINSTTKLEHFDLIVPCGIREHGVASLQTLGCEPAPTVRALAEQAISEFETVFSAPCTSREGF